YYEEPKKTEEENAADKENAFKEVEVMHRRFYLKQDSVSAPNKPENEEVEDNDNDDYRPCYKLQIYKMQKICNPTECQLKLHTKKM
ncbi:hypothetical protein HK096_004611, partial [Nowakowskiella sp. JEL0078]